MTEPLYNQESEVGFLAGILRNPDDYWSINEVGVKATDLGRGTAARKLMEAIEAVVAEKHPPSPTFVSEELWSKNLASTVEYMERLVRHPVHADDARDFAQTVKGLSVSRELAKVGSDIIDIATEYRADAESAVLEAEKALRAVSVGLRQSQHSPDPADILKRLREPEAPGIPIRFMPTLQKLTGGWLPGQIWVVGGYSSVGKSSCAVNIIGDVLSTTGKWVGLISTEMTQESYMVRLLSLYSMVPQRSIRDRVVLPHIDTEALAKAEAFLSSANLRIYDTVNKLSAIRSAAIRQKETVGLDVLIVDFVQNVRASIGDMSYGDMTEAALELQQLSKEIGCTVIAFSQISNSMAQYRAEGGGNEVYAFKGSGSLKDSADVAIMLERQRTTGSPVLRWEVVKNRSGSLGEIDSYMDLATGRILEIDREEPDDG